MKQICCKADDKLNEGKQSSDKDGNGKANDTTLAPQEEFSYKEKNLKAQILKGGKGDFSKNDDPSKGSRS